MIQILRGSESTKAAHFARLARAEGRHVWLVGRPAAVRSWDAYRNVHRQILDRLGPDLTEGILNPHRAEASLVFHELEDGLTPSEALARERLVARLDSHMTHNWIIQRPLLEALTTLLFELLRRGGWTLLVPDLRNVDPETMEILWTMHRLYPDRLPDAVIGDPSDVEKPRPDESGIFWDPSPWNLLHLVYSFLADGTAQSVDLSGGSGAPEIRLADLYGMVLGQQADRESLAFEALRATSATPSAAVSGQVLRAIECAFRSYSFTTTLRLGLEFLARDPDLSGADKAKLHGMIGLSAHNRQFNTKEGNSSFNDFLLRHFLAAFEAEPPPEQRCALLYRLAVTVGRRRREVEAALPWANRAVEEAREACLPDVQRIYLEAWARNIRSYVFLFLKQVSKAAEDAETAGALLGQAQGLAEGSISPRDFSLRDVTASHGVVAHNVAALAHFAGDEEGARSLKRVATRIVAEFSGIDQFEAFGWIDIYRGLLRLDLALTEALSGLASAVSERDPMWEFRYTVEAADLCYRLGEVARSREHFLSAKALRSRLGDPEILLSVDPSLAAACARAGFLDEATALLQAVLEREETAEPASPHSTDKRAELLAALGVVSALRNDPSASEIQINDAIDLAVASGERDTLVRIAAATGWANQLLDRQVEAADAYARGLDIADAGLGPDRAPPSVVPEILATLVGLLECRAQDPVLLRRVVELVPVAIAHPDTWWNIPRVLSLLTTAAQANLVLPWELMAESLSIVVSAARLRSDCMEILRDYERAVASKAIRASSVLG